MNTFCRALAIFVVSTGAPGCFGKDCVVWESSSVYVLPPQPPDAGADGDIDSSIVVDGGALDDWLQRKCEESCKILHPSSGTPSTCHIFGPGPFPDVPGEYQLSCMYGGRSCGPGFGFDRGHAH